jgi:hypothetical protein
MPEDYWNKLVKSVNPPEPMAETMRAAFYWGIAASMTFIGEIEQVPSGEREAVFKQWVASIERDMTGMTDKWEGELHGS